jgi:hypothetical protein
MAGKPEEMTLNVFPMLAENNTWLLDAFNVTQSFADPLR